MSSRLTAQFTEWHLTLIRHLQFKLSESQFQSLMGELSICQDLFHSSLTWQLVFPQKIISWKMSQEVLLTSWLRNSKEKSLRTLMVMICSSSMRTYSWLRRMTEQACSEKVFSRWSESYDPIVSHICFHKHHWAYSPCQLMIFPYLQHWIWSSKDQKLKVIQHKNYIINSFHVIINIF